MFEIKIKASDMFNRLSLALFFSTVVIAASAQTAVKASVAKPITEKNKTTTVALTAKKDTVAKNDTVFRTVAQLNKLNINALPESKHQIAVYSGYGLSTLKYKPTFGKYHSGTDFNIGADYIYYFKQNWGFSAGLNFSRYNSEFTASTNTIWNAVDDENETFGLMAEWNGWTEQHKLTTLGIPIMGRYRYPINAKWTALAGLGLKLGFVTSSSIAPTTGDVTLRGQYNRLGVVFDSIPREGFGKQQYRNKTEFKPSLNLSAIAEVGASYQIDLAWSIFAGCYFDLGLTNLAKPTQEPLVGYNSSNNTPHYNTLPSSNTISKESSLAVGAKIGVTYDFGGAKLLRKAKSDENARLVAEAARLAREAALRQAQLDKEAADAAAARAAAALLAAQLRQKQVADSIELARQKSLQDSIAAIKSKGEGKMVVDIRTDKLAPWERELLMLPVEFKLGSAAMTPESNENAEKIGEMLSRHADLKVRITGHTCDLGPDEANYRLGLRRAKALEVAFSNAGEPKEKMTTLSKGEKEPVVPNTSETNRKKNRRVLVVIEDEITETQE